ncbi:mechanosensitive ion channel family protein [Planktotalea sp.]|uniref:mechanosensitive ion channel family protein n=1 Tax=Planktotalea sp. TaxID=2029877 RepID=UPI003C77BB1C
MSDTVKPTTLEQTRQVAADATAPVVEPDALSDLRDAAFSFADFAQSVSESMLRPWIAYQILIAAAVFVLAHFVALFLKPRFHSWMRAREGWPTWRMRILVMLHRRLRLLVYVVLMWIAVLIMRELTWPSRSYLLAIIANLATAWFFVAFVTRFIHNALLRSIIRYGAWIWVTLSIVNLTDETQNLLQSIAFELGTVRLSLWLVLQAIIILAVLFAGARFLSTVATASIRKNDDISPSMQVLAVKFLQVSLYGAAFFMGVRAVGVDLTGLAILSGAIGVGLGFGLQKVVSNLVSGVIILLDKSIKPGDVISLGETFGWINSLGARYVSVVTRDGKEYLIPNEDLITGQVVNWSHSSDYVRLDIFFGAAYDDDPHKVRALAVEAAQTVNRVLGKPRAPVCHVVGFGDSSVDYILRFWIMDPTAGLTNVRGAVFLALWDTFKENGISIPFPQREVRMLEDGNAILD